MNKRQTGRTTRMVSDAVDAALAENGREVAIVATPHDLVHYIPSLIQEELVRRGHLSSYSRGRRRVTVSDYGKGALLLVSADNGSVQKFCRGRGCRVLVDHAACDCLSHESWELVRECHERSYPRPKAEEVVA